MLNKENTQEYSKDTLRIQIIDSKNNPIKGAEVILLGMGQREGQKITLPDKTDSQGEITFNFQKYIKNINRFEITINHPDYYSYPINRNRKICRSYEYGHLCVESFAKIPTFYFDGKTLNISQCPNPAKRYALKNLPNQDSNNQTQKEYYIQLQNNQKNFSIYKDKNLTEASDYILHLEYSSQTTTQPEENKNLNFDNDDTLRKFNKEIESIIKMNEKKGNTQSIHKFVIDYSVPDFIAKALNLIDEFENRNTQGVFLSINLTELKKGQLNTNPFDKNLIIETLKERIVNLAKNSCHTTSAPLPSINNSANSYYPNQGPTSLCGPAAFFYCLLIDRPDLYVKCVIDLWEKGEVKIKNLSIKPSEDCKKPKSLENGRYNKINGIDWITLASLRDSENIIFSYDEASDQAAGITLAGALKEWFLKVGAKLLFSNVTYGLHIGKDELLCLVKYKQQYSQAHIVSLINAELIGGSSSGIPGIKKSHWIVWKTTPQSNGKDIDLNTQKEEIKQEVFSWGKIDRKPEQSTLTDYLSYNFGAIVFLPIPYELGECE
ncbi:hypothetical protein [Helicobacter japonicus]|uniref:hypothetical protein n=2 Tax=Helicobacter japonicus TaxID=425400 RepID=UPI000A7D8FDE|nr:hypothetical protein [Helicobacter japonicus]